MKKFIGIWAAAWAVLVLLGILIPALLVDSVTEDSSRESKMQASPETIDAEEDSLQIPVYLTEEDKIITIPLEAYVSGVVAAEMPAEFDLEALKAQAIAARTYIIHRALLKDFSQVPVQGAWVTDSVSDQAFLTIDAIRENWGFWKTARFLDKIYQAVNETRGIIMTHNGQPIDATFFSTSNGYTENSEDYWSQEVPYLRSVPSPWDVHISPKYKHTVSLSLNEFYNQLGIHDIPVSSGASLSMQVLERTKGNRIKSVRIGGRQFSGREIREKLGLPSSHFQWKVNEDSIDITTYGYGHGVGMSQYGAQGMAMEGYTAEQILKYYYQGIELKDWREDPNIAEIKNL